MLKSSGAIGVATVISRVLGLLREMAYAAFMGVGWVADAFLLAFTIPNLFRRLLGEGALTAAFIPIFKEKETTAGKEGMWRTSNAVISGLLLATIGIVLLCIGIVSVIIARGGLSGKPLLLLELLRWMFPYLIFVCVAALFMGMLNARGHFFVPALGAALLNVVMIASVLWLAPRMGNSIDQQVFGLAIGVVVAGVAQALFQWPLLHREGFRFHWVSPWGDPAVREVVRRMIPGTIGVAAFQINVLITKCLAFSVGTGVVASFDYAVRLMELPQGIFGLSLATYLLPTLSGLFAEKKYDDFRGTIAQALGYLVFINLLATVFLVVLAEPMVRLIFERRSFDEAATTRTTWALMALAPGLLAFSGVNILARAFYAAGDTTTPMKISVFCLGLNVVVTAALVWPLHEIGMGLANTLTSCINALLLTYGLRRKFKRLDWTEPVKHLPGLCGAAVIAGGLAWWLQWAWARQVGYGSFAGKIGHVFVPMCAATAVYIAMAWWLKVPYANDMLALGRIRSRRL
jgi:putative peptidoglycan lipid II flippase